MAHRLPRGPELEGHVKYDRFPTCLFQNEDQPQSAWIRDLLLVNWIQGSFLTTWADVRLRNLGFLR